MHLENLPKCSTVRQEIKYKLALFVALLIGTMNFHAFYEINQNRFRLLCCTNFAL